MSSHIEAETKWHFPDNIFQCIFLNENVWISNTIWLEFVMKGPIDNNTALVQIMVWRWTGNKPLSEPMMAWAGDTYMHHSASVNLQAYRYPETHKKNQF